jgi:hypothetical protein
VEFVSEIDLLKRVLNVSILDETYDPSNFGNAAIRMMGPRCSVRLVRERGQIFLDISRPSGQWLDANDVLEAAHLHPSPGNPLPGKELIPLICANFEEIKKLLDRKLDLHPASPMKSDTLYIDHDFSKGWPAGPDLFYECQRCGELLSSIFDGECRCGNVFVDPSSARAGAVDESKVRLVKQIK